MKMSDRDMYEYAVIRYVPSQEREEFINIGLLMLCKRRRWIRGAVRLDAERLRAIDKNLDLEFLTNQSRMFTEPDNILKAQPVEERYRWLTAVKSSVLRTSPSHPGLLIKKESSGEKEFDNLSNDDLESEFERLMFQLV